MKRDFLSRPLAGEKLKDLVGWQNLESIFLLDRNDETISVETFHINDYKENKIAGYYKDLVYVYEN